MKDEGRVIQPLGDRAGSPIQLPATQEVDALGRAVRYLEKRFGQLGSAPNLPQVIGRLEEEEVLRDERQEYVSRGLIGSFQPWNAIERARNGRKGT